MRGYAIILIVLHNYSHVMDFVINENEFSFSYENANGFFHQIGIFSEIWIYNLFSFLGWYGVPVFVFLTAFGLVRKYESDNSPHLNKRHFLYYNWLKLFVLLLPSIICFAAFDSLRWIDGSGEGIIKIIKDIFMLSFLNDMLFPWIPPCPFIYWYLGMTLELYFIYSSIIYNRSIKSLLILTIVSILFPVIIMPSDWNNNTELYIKWFRINATGWMLPYTFGIIFARTKHIASSVAIFTMLAAFLLFFPTMMNQWLWQISLICAILIIIVIAFLSDRIPFWRELWIWIGKLSPFIYVAHPIVRQLMYRCFPFLISDPHIYFIFFYLIGIIICALGYQRVWKWLAPKVEQILTNSIHVLFHRFQKL